MKRSKALLTILAATLVTTGCQWKDLIPFYGTSDKSTLEMLMADKRSQYFSGGTKQNAIPSLKKIAISKIKFDTLIKLSMTDNCYYSITYLDINQTVKIDLQQCHTALRQKSIRVPRSALIKKSLLKTSDHNTTTITFSLKQHARLNVIETHKPANLLINITPIYPLFTEP